MIDYPKSHFFQEELDAKKQVIDKLYKEYFYYIENARTEYQEAISNFKKMSIQHGQAHEILKKIAQELQELEALTVKPLIP